MRKLIVLSSIFGLLVLAPSAFAVDRYAAPGGTGPVISCPKSNPCNISDAFSTVYTRDGDVIVLAPGSYLTSSTLQATKRVDVIGTGATAADTKVGDSAGFTGYEVLDLHSDGSSIQDLEVDATQPGTVSGTPYYALALDGEGTMRRVIARNSIASGCTTGGGLVADSLCVTTGAATNSGLNYEPNSAVNLSVRNSTMVGVGTGTTGVYGYTSSADAQITLLSTIASGTQASVSICAHISYTMTMFAAESNYATVATPSCGGTAFPVAPGTGDNQTAAPVFSNSAAGDFTEAAGSPTIDAGSTSVLTDELDLAGAPRTQGTATDIGAYEFAPPAPPPAKDTTPPTITIKRKPKSKGTTRKDEVKFVASETATFQCKLDKGKWAKCTSPWKKTVKRGSHKLQIRATDSAGNVSKTTTVRWKVVKKK